MCENVLLCKDDWDVMSQTDGILVLPYGGGKKMVYEELRLASSCSTRLFHRNQIIVLFSQ